MASHVPPWLQRWQQAPDDELLYVDQTILTHQGVPLEDDVWILRPPAEEDDDEP